MTQYSLVGLGIRSPILKTVCTVDLLMPNLWAAARTVDRFSMM